MLGFLDHADHFPGCCKDCFITLFLPKINIELPVSRLAPHNPAPEFGGRLFFPPTVLAILGQRFLQT